jgi:hypothetical protein
MPSIAEFLGMWITINWADHNPPHIHVQAGEYSASVMIKSGEILSGYIPPKKLKQLQSWVIIHQQQLMENWELAQTHQALKPIKDE